MTALAAVLSLLTGVTGYAADKITLACSGTSTLGSDKKPINMHLVIDLDRGTVKTGEDEAGFSIAKVTETQIEFKDINNWGMQGRIDRITGSVLVTYSDGSPMYELTCKPAKPLFLGWIV